MLIVSAGMPKSGSGWYYNLTNDLLIAAGQPDAREIRERHELQHVLLSANCNLRKTDAATLDPLVRVAQEHGYTFACKTHRRASKALRRHLEAGNLKATYTFRDLRDVIISALDRSKAMHEKGELKGRHWYIGPQRSFAKYRTVRDGIRWCHWRLMPVWRSYMNCEGAHTARYEDLEADPMGEMKKLAAYLEVEVPESTMQEIIDRYDRSRVSKTKVRGMHFNKGVSGRHVEKMTDEEKALCMRKLSRELKLMGYID